MDIFISLFGLVWFGGVFSVYLREICTVCFCFYTTGMVEKHTLIKMQIPHFLPTHQKKSHIIEKGFSSKI